MDCLQLLLGFLVAVVIFVTVLKLACRLCILFKNHILQLLCCGAVIAIIFLFRESIEENLRACLVWPPLEPYLSLFDSVSHFVLITVIGGFFVWLGCKVCMAVGAIWRLWLHRRIARMSYTFAVIFCCVVIASPIVISVPLLRAMEQCGTVFVERNNLSENLPDKTETASNEAVDNAENKQTPAQGVANLVHHAVSGYFYAIQQGDGEKMLRLGEKSIGLIFGLVGYLIFSGFTVSIFVNMVSKKQERIAQGEEYYSNLKNHYVIIGSGALLETVIKEIEARQQSDDSKQKDSKGKFAELVLRLCHWVKMFVRGVLKSLFEKPADIVILSSESIIELRKRLSATLPERCMSRLVFVHGDRTNKEDLLQLGIPSCREIYLLGDFDVADQDDRNLASLTHVDEILEEKPNKVRVENKKSQHAGTADQETPEPVIQQPAPSTVGDKKPGKDAAALTEAKSGQASVLPSSSIDRKRCKIYLNRYHTFGLFQSFIKNTMLNKLDLEPICFYKQWSEVVLGIRDIEGESKHKTYVPFDRGLGETIKDGKKQMEYVGIDPDSDNFVHLVVIGMSRMGMSLVTEAAQLLHFPNGGKKRTKITMIDTKARQEMYRFVNLHSSLFSEAYYTYTEFEDVPFGGKSSFQKKNEDTGWLDVEFHFIQGNAECEDVRKFLESYAQEPGVRLTVAVSLPDARHALSLGLSLPRSLYNKDNVNILIQQETGEGLLSLLNQQSEADSPYTNVRPFGMLNVSMKEIPMLKEVEYIPHLFYEPECNKTRESWSMLYDEVVAVNRNNQATKSWAEMKLWERISNRYAAVSRDFKRRSFGLTGSFADDEKRVFSAEAALLHGAAEHNRWCVEKLITGFRALTADEKQKFDSGTPGYSKSELRAQFAHDGIRKWSEIVENPNCSSYKHNSINMGRGICFLCELQKEEKIMLPPDFRPQS